ncbi:DUF6662 family protein [Emcibacter nanhaiensis]|uniref:Uncharacterized protein n=1 Tax=Emcibacter nanhaiensis TaxID=1505037 RepID=A0A501PBV8_9PROT|nr:DUF6662 family protein [Emcibacter nanhaiensis]TPD57492.1 hypothetical protein FIV46_15345 [Emcibacter nanhaiensis]
MKRLLTLTLALCGLTTSSYADESLWGVVKGAEPLPKGAQMISIHAIHRSDKGAGEYKATDYQVEVSKGFTNKLTGSLYLLGMGINTSGIRIDGYMPADRDFDFKLTGFELALKYNFLSPALDDIGLSTYLSLSRTWVDPHSGQSKNKTTGELKLLLQKYFLDGQLITAANVGIEVTSATRGEIAGLPEDFEWPTFPEMEIGLNGGAAVSYRFADNFYFGVEAVYDAEYETEVGQERWSIFAGPNLHYGGQKWWATLSWLRQLKGGGEMFDAQSYDNLHLIEKTRDEFRLKFGFSF